MAWLWSRRGGRWIRARLLAATVATVAASGGCGPIFIGDGVGFDGFDGFGDLGVGASGTRGDEFCRTVSEAQCHAGNGCAPYFAFPIDAMNVCFDESAGEYLGCHGLPCSNQVVLGRDSSGAYWRFPGGCVKPGWTELGTSTQPPCVDTALGGQGGAGGAGGVGGAD